MDILYYKNVEDIKPNKSLGQNFLKDEKIAQLMAEELEMHPSDTIVEVGPGKGILTDKLIEIAVKKIIPVEIDPRLVVDLRKKLEGQRGVQIVFADVLNWLPDYEIFSGPNKDLKIIGSLPYNITSPLLNRIVNLRAKPEICVFLVQKEVGKKICAQPPDSSFLSVFVQTFFETKYIETVPKKKFDPVPKVDGGIIKISRRQELPVIDIKKYERFLHEMYANPRKMLNKALTKKELEITEIDGMLRPQNLSAEQWVNAFKTLE